MNRSRGKIIWHIGQHKTGSKALQSFLACNTTALRQHGIFYPISPLQGHSVKAYKISQYAVFVLLRREALKAVGQDRAARLFWSEYGKYCHPFDSLQAIFNSFEADQLQLSARTLLISAEDLFDMHLSHEEGFSMALVDAGTSILAQLMHDLNYDSSIVVYVRRQDHLLGSHYAQYVKGPSRKDMEFSDFAEMFAARLKTRAILQRWEAAFGKASIKVRRYESVNLPEGIVADFFEHALGFHPPANCSPPPADPEYVNRTPGRDWIEFIRLLNLRSSEGLPNFSREDVLKVAASGASEGSRPPGIHSWLSPRARNSLLKACEQGNAEIAAEFLGRPVGPLFDEPCPDNDGDWHEYEELSAERVAEMVSAVEEVVPTSGFARFRRIFRKVTEKKNGPDTFP